MSPGKRPGYASLPFHDGTAPAWLFSRRRSAASRSSKAEGSGPVRRINLMHPESPDGLGELLVQGFPITYAVP